MGSSFTLILQKMKRAREVDFSKLKDKFPHLQNMNNDNSSWGYRRAHSEIVSMKVLFVKYKTQRLQHMRRLLERGQC